ARAMAIVQTSVFDAVNAIDGSPYEGMVVQAGPAAMTASKEAAIASAAHKALLDLFPDQAFMLNQAYADRLNQIADGAEKTQGIQWGEQVAQQVLDIRANDGHDGVVTYIP